MCGITGIFSFDKNNKVEKAELVKMNNALMHRGPDGAGVFIEKMISDNKKGAFDNGLFLWQLLVLKQHY